METLKKHCWMCRGQNKMDCSMEIYNAKRWNKDPFWMRVT
jgi:hypothetical protein